MNNCFICNKPTHNKPKKLDIVLCCAQCTWIYNDFEKIRMLTRKIAELQSDFAKLLKLLENRFKKD